jgi:hypothetical protein
MKAYVGTDRNGTKLFESDICTYTITYPENGVTNQYYGMIIYDPSEFAFMFEQTNDDFPLVLMNIVNVDSIEKVMSIEEMQSSYPEYETWQEIYESNFGAQ